MMRHALLQDLPEIVNIYNQVIPGRMVTADLEPVSVESRKAWFHSHAENARPLFVFEEAGDIKGWLSFKDFYGRPAYKHTAEISIYIHEKYRGKGLGKYLLDYAVSQCAALQIYTLLGFIFAHNQPSIKLFQKNNFQTWGHLPQVAILDGIWRDVLIMGRKI